MRWRPRPLLDWCSLEPAGLIAAAGLLDLAAGTGLSYVAGFGEVRTVLAVVMAGFSGFFAHGGRTPDDLALQKAGAD